jgi:hypothetical protein
MKSPRIGRILVAVAAALALAGFGCSSLPAARAPAIDRVELVKSATFDHACPAEEIRVLHSEDEPSGTASFLLDVCGTQRTYKRVGTMYFEAGVPDPLS